MIDFGIAEPDFLARLLAAALMGGLVGLERDVHGRAAGLRTHMLVALGAGMFMVLSEIVADRGNAFAASLGEVGRFADPGRIAAQVVTGIGFLGAGTILKEGFTVRGLTTAATLWMVAAIGMACGSGQYMIAAAGTALAILGLMLLNYAERGYRKDAYRMLRVVTDIDTDPSLIIDAVKSKRVRIIFFDLDRDYEAGRTTVKLSLRLHHRGTTDKLSHQMIKRLTDAGVPLRGVGWHHP